MSTTTTRHGSYTTVVGDRHDPNRHPNETAKLIRQDIRAAVSSGELPAMTYSVGRGCGWHDLDITVVADPQTWALEPGRPALTEQAVTMGRVLADIAARYFRVTSDPQTDYHQGGICLVYAHTAPGGGLIIG